MEQVINISPSGEEEAEVVAKFREMYARRLEDL
jgi:hypothetical protein